MAKISTDLYLADETRFGDKFTPDLGSLFQSHLSQKFVKKIVIQCGLSQRSPSDI